MVFQVFIVPKVYSVSFHTSPYIEKTYIQQAIIQQILIEVILKKIKVICLSRFCNKDNIQYFKTILFESLYKRTST